MSTRPTIRARNVGIFFRYPRHAKRGELISDRENAVERVLPILYELTVDVVLAGTFVWTTVFVSVP
jgi:hypothetical protein